MTNIFHRDLICPISDHFEPKEKWLLLSLNKSFFSILSNYITEIGNVSTRARWKLINNFTKLQYVEGEIDRPCMYHIINMLQKNPLKMLEILVEGKERTHLGKFEEVFVALLDHPSKLDFLIVSNVSEAFIHLRGNELDTDFCSTIIEEYADLLRPRVKGIKLNHRIPNLNLFNLKYLILDTTHHYQSLAILSFSSLVMNNIEEVRLELDGHLQHQIYPSLGLSKQIMIRLFNANMRLFDMPLWYEHDEWDELLQRCPKLELFSTLYENKEDWDKQLALWDRLHPQYPHVILKVYVARDRTPPHAIEDIENILWCWI